MIKFFSALSVAASVAALAPLSVSAAPVYFNPEANVGASAADGVGGADVDLHFGIEGNGAYAQIGPMLRIPDTGTDTEVGISGKAGYGFGPGYTELSFATIDSDTSFNLKVGGKFDL